MQRWTALALVALTGVFVAALVLGRGGRGAGAGARDAGADAAPDAALQADAATAADHEVDAGGEVDGGGPALDEPPSMLPSDAPKSVSFGVILIEYRGAQGASPGARTRDEALELAKKLAEEAKADFKAAVAKGDKGSMESAGRMPRGMLEPGPERALFTLDKDGVSDPVDTPRGYWIVRRID